MFLHLGKKILNSLRSVFPSIAISAGLVSLLVSLVFSQEIADNTSCFECHGEVELVGEMNGQEISMYIDTKEFQQSIHGDMSCTDCHDDIEELPHDDTLERVSCANCHEDVAEELSTSIHANKGGPSCIVCHGDPHQLHGPSDKRSNVNIFHVQTTCGQCHSVDHLIRHYDTNAPLIETLYQDNVHTAELLAGNEKAPSCIQCHGYHDILPMNNNKSRTNFLNVAQTCGQCHEKERDRFLESKHGVSATAGHKDAPICTDCHGEHLIYRVSDERSPVSLKNVSTNTCARCHSSIVINEKYNIPSTKVSEYYNSYHGLALQHGSKQVANCNSCHGNHLILPSSDPRSTVSPQRLVETCGQCHPGISTNVLAAPIHSEITIRSKTIVAWIPLIYIPLIILVIGGMLAHNGLILWTLLKEKFRKESSEESYQRFSRCEIICHIVLSITFLLLAITGFALVNPKSWWVTMLSYLGFSEEIRMIVHRVSAVGMLATSFLYAIQMVATRRGRSEFIAFLPRPRDLVHVYQHLAFHLGKRSEPPRFDRYDYTEKMEFWALIWGIIIMAVTGLILWFPILAFQYLPKWAIDMAQLIHYYEAILATLAILVWHFFFVIFHPEEYPMSVTWLTGKMTLEHLRRRHPLEYEKWQKKQ